MIQDLLAAADWTAAPVEMEFTLPYGELILEVKRLVESMLSYPAPGDAVSLYTKAPGLVNVALNYKICVEHDLPLHPTVYYELKEAKKYRVDHELEEVVRANSLFLESIRLAGMALALAPGFSKAAEDFLARLPPELPRFVYTGIRDTYTWRGSDPVLLERLALAARSGFDPELIVAAAHGSIMPGLLLAQILQKPLYFIRLSMFKRNDEEPIVTLSDEAWLYEYRGARVLLYDEDVAGGRTLTLFENRLKPLFAQTRTACSIRHAGAAIRPDYCAKVFWE